MVAILTKELLQPQRIAVSTEGDKVVFAVGNAEMRMTYETAFALSTWLRLHGRAAKRFAGDTSRHMTAGGILHDAARAR